MSEFRQVWLKSSYSFALEDEMRKYLCICNTNSQIIVALQIRLMVLKDCSMTLLLSERLKNVNQIVEAIREEEIFDSVGVLGFKKNPFKNKFTIRLFEALNGITSFALQSKELLGFYDELLFFNYGSETAAVFSYLCKQNYNIVCSRFEEGILSYNNFFHDGHINHITPSLKVISCIRYLIGKKVTADCLQKFYCFYPTIYEGDLEVVKIPLINHKNNRIVKITNRAYGIDPNKLDYQQKFIYFASIGDFEGEQPIGELKLAKQIAGIVGKDNLLVKVHPRDTSNEFTSSGLHIDKNSVIPWEAIQLNYDFSEYVFLTAFSGSVLCVNLMIDKRPKTFFMYPLCDVSHNSTVRISTTALDLLFEKSNKLEVSLNNIYLANSLKDIIQ